MNSVSYNNNLRSKAWPCVQSGMIVMGITNHFLIVFSAHSTRWNPYLAKNPWLGNWYAWDKTTATILLTGQSTKCPLNFYLYIPRLVQLSDIIREVSLSSVWQLTQKLKTAPSDCGVLIYKCGIYHTPTVRLRGHRGWWGGKTARGEDSGNWERAASWYDRTKTLRNSQKLWLLMQGLYKNQSQYGLGKWFWAPTHSWPVIESWRLLKKR